jgi:hypothetical protein
VSDWLKPQWPAPASVEAIVTTRSGGVSQPPWDSFNPALHVGDDPQAVASNRERLQQRMGYQRPVQWLTQVHGNHCAVVTVAGAAIEADAAYTRTPEQPIAVMTADCLSVFLCDRQGREVAVAHAGWRGLCAGILEATVRCFEAPADTLLAWLGPAIGPAAFQVGAEVRDAFIEAMPHQAAATQEAFCADGQGRFLADIDRLARLRLQACGVQSMRGGGLCTVSDAGRFYSYRRDGVTGRMASVIVLRQ